MAGSALAYLALPYRPHDLTGRRRDASAVAVAHERFAGVGQVLPPTAALALLGFVEGDWTAALDAWTSGRAASRGGPTRHPYQYAPVAVGRIARARGDTTAARAAVAGLLAGPGDEPGDLSLYLGLGVQALAADLALDAGNRDEARDWLAAHDRWLAWSGAVLWRAEGQLGWAAYHRAGGDVAQARQHAEAARAHASEPHQPLALLAAHRLLGELDTAAGRYAEARAHLDAALALAEACAAPYERALTLLGLADLHAATGHRAEVATALDGAVALLAPLDARPALARAESLGARLAATATPLCVGVPADTDGLTAREAAVLRLVALGLTNREVAARLAISPRTVGAHLNAIYGKLGVTTRTAAAHEGRRRGLA